jgi:hypothetical protein
MRSKQARVQLARQNGILVRKRSPVRIRALHTKFRIRLGVSFVFLAVRRDYRAQEASSSR